MFDHEAVFVLCNKANKKMLLFVLDFCGNEKYPVRTFNIVFLQFFCAGCMSLQYAEEKGRHVVF